MAVWLLELLCNCCCYKFFEEAVANSQVQGYDGCLVVGALA